MNENACIWICTQRLAHAPETFVCDMQFVLRENEQTPSFQNHSMVPTLELVWRLNPSLQGWWLCDLPQKVGRVCFEIRGQSSDGELSKKEPR
jgi:hypothetical protein